MVTRRQKLIAAGIVLAVGFGLAWPLRRAEPLLPASVRQVTASVETRQLTQAIVLDEQPPPMPVAASPTAPDRDPFASSTAPSAANPATSPVYSTVSVGSTPSTPLTEVTPTERIHVVHEGDSLDVLAKRYLGDEARALEIFDLNREALENPHVLPLGVELRIPSGGSAVGD